MSKYAKLLQEDNNKEKLNKFFHDNFLNRKTIEKSYKYYKTYKHSIGNLLKDVPEIESLKEK